jgi:predicted SPOUT superfamily RNA methylase MTH1
LKEEAYSTLAYASPAHTTRNHLYNASNALKLVTPLPPVKTPHYENPAVKLTTPENVILIMRPKDA